MKNAERVDKTIMPSPWKQAPHGRLLDVTQTLKDERVNE